MYLENKHVHLKEVLATGEVVFETVVKQMTVDITKGEKVFKDATKVLLDEEAPKPNTDCGFCCWAKGADNF